MDPRERVGRAAIELAAIARALPLPGSPKAVVKAALHELDNAEEEFHAALTEYCQTSAEENCDAL